MSDITIKQLEKDIKEEDVKANHKYVQLAWSIYKLCLKIDRPNQKVTTTFAQSRGHGKKTFHEKLETFTDSNTYIRDFRNFS